MEGTDELLSAPAAHQENASAADSPGADAPLILMVDDDATLRMLYERYLTYFGYRTLFAANGEEALRLASEAPDIRLIIFDLMMPGLSGKELATRLAARLPQAVFLFCSGHPANTLVRLGIDMKGAQFMQKPCRPMDLKQRLSEMLAMR